jgi:hypothetical protein
VLGVARPRICRIGVNTSVNFITERIVCAFSRIVFVKRGRNFPPFERMEIYPAGDRINSSMQGGQV